MFFQILHSNPTLCLGLAAIFGLCVGSFLNVVIYRIPIMMTLDGEPQPEQKRFDLVMPPSHCTHCKSHIPWWANIPVFSYLFLRGRSVCCQQKIALRYPLIELSCMLLTVFTAYFFGFNWQAFAAMIFCWGMIALIFIDIDEMLLPDDITLPLLWLGLYVNVFNLFTTPSAAIIGAISGYCVFWSIGWLFKQIRGIEGMGYGDYKLLALIGAWLGWQQIPFIILGSSLVGAIYGGLMLILRRQNHQQPIPFGPFLAAAGIIGLFYGENLMLHYLHWLGFNLHSLSIS